MRLLRVLVNTEDLTILVHVPDDVAVLFATQPPVFNVELDRGGSMGLDGHFQLVVSAVSAVDEA
jgi:hypothetical protein